MTYAAITGWGKCMPPAVLTNADLASIMETDDEWITSRTGIRERRVSHVTAIELSHVAAARALACAGLDAQDVDLIVYGSCSNDETVPNSASGVQLRLGATNAASMDVNTACTSFLYGLSTATAMIRTGVVRNAVVIGVELISQFMDWTNRGVAVLFGDGAAAVVLQATDARGRADRREARLQRRRARHPARARDGNGLRASRRDAGRHRMGLRRPGDLQARRGRDGAAHRSDVLAKTRRTRSTRSTSSSRTRRTCASSSRWRSASARRWSAVYVTVSATATCRRRRFRSRWSMRSRKAASSRAR